MPSSTQGTSQIQAALGRTLQEWRGIGKRYAGTPARIIAGGGSFFLLFVLGLVHYILYCMRSCGGRAIQGGEDIEFLTIYLFGRDIDPSTVLKPNWLLKDSLEPDLRL